MTPNEISHWEEEHSFEYKDFISVPNNSYSETIVDTNLYLGNNQKGVYVCRMGGLPLFSSGNRVAALCDPHSMVFSEPCDNDHVSLVDIHQLLVYSQHLTNSITAAEVPTSRSSSSSRYLVRCNRSNQIIGKVVAIPNRDCESLTSDSLRHELKDLASYIEFYNQAPVANVLLKTLTELKNEADATSSEVTFFLVIDPRNLIFLPLRSKWPIPSQPGE
jgi:hypothetical protein